jgi:bifunctional non-homologous end joining protein LigD
VVIDGEMVAMRDDQTCDMWALLRDTRNGISERLTFVAFDLLFLKGEDLRQQPLLARKQKLRELLGAADLSRIKYSEHLEYDEQKNVDGPNIWTNVHGVNVEGIVSKRIDSCYRSQGGDDWIKTPCQYREVLPIVGMAMDGEKLGGLYLARKQSGSLLYAGQLEEGLNDEIRADLLDKLTPFVTKRPTVETYTVKTDATWLQPVCKARIVHRGGMNAIPVRRAAFEGLIAAKVASKAAAASVRENVMRELTDAVVPSKAKLTTHWRKYAKLALPHLANRPLTLVRHVDGITFFTKGNYRPFRRTFAKLKSPKRTARAGFGCLSTASLACSDSWR